MTSGHKMAKGFGYALAVLIILAIVGGVTTAIIAITNGAARFKLGDDYETSDYTSTFDNINNLELDGGYAYLSVREGNVDKVTAKCTNIPDYFTLEASGDTLKLDRATTDSWFVVSFGFDHDETKIEIIVPAGQRIENCDIESGSGGCEIDLSNVGEAEIETGSGDVDILNVVADRFSLESGSGSISMMNINTAQLTVKSGSGSVKMDEIDAGSFEVRSGSGRLSYEGTIGGDIYMDTKSGNVVMNIDGKRDDYNINVNSGSGGVWIDDEKMNDAHLTSLTSQYDMRIDGGSGRVTVAFSNR